MRSQLNRNRVATLHGHARFLDPHTLEIESTEGTTPVRADQVLIACGTRPAHSDTVPLDGKRIVDSDQLLQGDVLPRDLIVVGAGVIGLEYASMVSALNIKVTVIEARPAILDFVDRELIDSLLFFMRQRGAAFRLGEKVLAVGYDEKNRVVAKLESGKEVHGDTLLYTVGRRTNADLLNLEAAGLSADERGRIAVNEFFRPPFRTSTPRATSSAFPPSRPRRWSRAAWRAATCSARTPEPAERDAYGIYTIPEISMVGKTEQELTQEKVPYEIGISKFEELAKGQMLGVETGLLKILFHRKTRQLLGVHIFGERATEIIHIGQAVLGFGGSIDYFRDAVFNYPTMAEAYKVAGLDGLNGSGTGSDTKRIRVGRDYR